MEDWRTLSLDQQKEHMQEHPEHLTVQWLIESHGNTRGSYFNNLVFLLPGSPMRAHIRGYRIPGEPLLTGRQLVDTPDGVHSEIWLGQTQEDFWATIDTLVDELVDLDPRFSVLKTFYEEHFDVFNQAQSFIQGIMSWDKGEIFLEGLIELCKKMKEMGYTYHEMVA